MDDPLLGLKAVLFVVQFILLIIPFYLSYRLEKEEEREFLLQARARKPV
ncbi:MAG: hypothetical protein ACUVX1_14905 [Chloroflexota bacterium]